MKKLLFLLLIFIVSVSANSFLDELTFEKIDRDHNGQISLEEVIAAANGDRHAGYAFKMLDMDVNGFVDRREFEYFYQQLKENAEEIERRFNGSNIDLK